VLFDLAARKFYIFGLAFWPQDFIFLALGLVLAGPDAVLLHRRRRPPVVRLRLPADGVDGSVPVDGALGRRRPQQAHPLDAAPWSADKLRRKGAKHLLWFVFALWTGITFVGFFTPIRGLAERAWPFAWTGWEIFWVLFYALATWGNAGVLREQVCKYMCPTRASRARCSTATR
jgi:polyferredoxin